MATGANDGVLKLFHPAVREWFRAAFAAPTRPQVLGWHAIAGGDSTLILAPTGSGKTLAAFLWAIDRLMFVPVPEPSKRCRILYISPIKALAVDVERNLRAPLAGIAEVARQIGGEHHEPSIALRTGDTPSAERARFQRHPGDILITTPESLYLLLTSNARAALKSVETVIVDEIHALAPTKRGSHLALSLERLEHLCGRRLQRIGLSATQRPLEEIAHFLAGTKSSSRNAGGFAGSAADPSHDQEDPACEFESSSASIFFRPVTIIDAGERKRLDLRIEVPLEDMARVDDLPATPGQPPPRPSIWSAIHPKLLGLVRAHRSTLIFVNSRRLAERISGAVNELAGETLVRAHHGSVAVSQRKEIEERLKSGALRGLVATSSLELGIDMGAVDLVVQVESPPSVASGMQRIGRASHQVGAISNGIIFPKYRADLVACAAVTRAMYQGEVEEVHYPRNALDVLAQQVVAMVAMDDWTVNELFDVIRRAAPYAALPRTLFESVLDMLAGRYPSDEFFELRPRLTWDRVSHRLSAREGARSIAVINGGTIPDRGLYGVFLSATDKPSRVGELDEEMVFESRAGDTIVLGASTWRIDQITHDRVLVSPAPGEPGKMPFWHGDTAARPAEFGARIGSMTRELLAMPRPAAFARLREEHSLDEFAAENLLRYLEDQRVATQRVPSDSDIVIERCRDELGDWRICVLSPFGSAVHAPWCMAAIARLRAERGLDPESMWSDDGWVLRLPETEEPIPTELLLPSPAEFRDLVLRQLGSSSLFAARFREAATRALLLPRRRPGSRSPLWQQRKRASDLLSVAARYSTFPMLMEAYRECLRETFDLPAATALLRRIESGDIRVTTVDSAKPSPFAAALLFSYVANYIYDGDAPLAERRAHALAIDQSQLEELLADSDLRELLDASAIADVEAHLQFTAPDYRARHADAVHDLLLRLGDLTAEEIAARSASPEVAASIHDLVTAGRAIEIELGGPHSSRPAAQRRDATGWATNHKSQITNHKSLPNRQSEFGNRKCFLSVEDAARYRDALGIALPHGLPEIWRRPARDPLLEIVRRYARTHGPFTIEEISVRYATEPRRVEPLLHSLHAQGRLLEGEFRPGGTHREWCDPDVLAAIRRRTLARLRKEIEPVEQSVFARLVARWQGVAAPRRGLDALLDAIEILQGSAIPISDLEREILPARVLDYRPEDLDTLMAAGEVVWVGVERVGDRDGRIALYLAQNLSALLAPDNRQSEIGNRQFSPRASRIFDFLQRGGASFFAPLHDASGGGFPGETQDALWELVWAGLVTNDTLQPVRNFLRPPDDHKPRPSAADGRPGSPEFLRRFRSRTGGGSQLPGRWSLVATRAHVSPAVPDHPITSSPDRQMDGPRPPSAGDPSPLTITAWSANLAQQLLARYGIVMRETAAAEAIPGGYSTIYPALRTMEESGWIRRGMFVAAMGAAQFAMPAAVDLLRSLRSLPETPEAIHLAASDPANPYGAFLPWTREHAGTSEEYVGTSDKHVGTGALACPADAPASALLPSPQSLDSHGSPENQQSEITYQTFPDNRQSAIGNRQPHGLSRSSGASVVLINGTLAAFLRRRNPALRVFLPEGEPERSNYARALARTLAEVAVRRQSKREGLLIEEINGAPAREHSLAPYLEESGFLLTARGYQMRRIHHDDDSAEG